MENKLQPCPCCGGKAKGHKWNFISNYYIKCEDCGFCTMLDCKSKEEAITRWNNRTTKNEKNELDITNCPLCGNEKILRTDDEYYKRMFCAKCWASTGKYKTLYEAIDAWNHRAGEE